MREDMYKGFTLTRDNVVPTLTLAVVIPAALYYAMCADLVRTLVSLAACERSDTWADLDGLRPDQAKGWDLPMTMDDTPSRRSARKPEDIQHGLTGFYNQYETKDA